jgi:glycosyltransferase involved in cell wall biosynthesis
MTSPKLSVITVVFNSLELLKQTVKSVHDQTYHNIEFIVVDGNSTDGTANFLSQSTDISCFISEPDKGIYDAMNKGLSLATGDYVIFINAGDQFYTNNTVEKVFETNKAFADVYFGNTMIIDEDNHEIGLRRLQPPENLNWKSLINGMLVCHQSIIVKRSIAPKYNIKYSVAADYQWVLGSLRNATLVCNTHLIISRFLDGGYNKKHILKSLKERFFIMSKHYGCIPVIFNHVRIGLKFVVFIFKNKRF